MDGEPLLGPPTLFGLARLRGSYRSTSALVSCLELVLGQPRRPDPFFPPPPFFFSLLENKKLPSNNESI